MGTPVVDQQHWRFGTDSGDPDPEDQTWDASDDQALTGQAKETPFFIRIQIEETGDSYPTGDKNWQLYYNTVDNPSTATIVDTAPTGVVQTVDDPGSNITDGDGTGTASVCAAQEGSWTEGYYVDASDQAAKLILPAGGYTEFQWCVQFTSSAADNQIHYFYIRFNGAVISNYNAKPTATTASATQTLTMENASHVHNVTSPAASRLRSLIVGSCSHVHPVTIPPLSRLRALVVSACQQLHNATEPAVEPKRFLAVDDCLHSHTSAAPVLQRLRSIAPNSASHVIGDTLTIITILRTLDVDDCLHTMTAEQIAVAIQNILVVANAANSILSQSPGIYARRLISETFDDATDYDEDFWQEVVN